MSAEVEASLTPEAAQELTDRLREATERLSRDYESWSRLVTEAYQRRAWAALGFASWETYVTEVLPAARVGQSDRRELVAALTKEGLSTRAIGSALGVSKNTVTEDRRQVSQTGTPGLEPLPSQQRSAKVEAIRAYEARRQEEREWEACEAEVVDAELVPDPQPAPRVVGLDGKTYLAKPLRDVPAPTPLPDPKPRRPSRKARAEMWENVIRQAKIHPRAMQQTAEELVAEVTVEELDRMREYLATLSKGATVMRRAKNVVQAAVDRLTTELPRPDGVGR